MSFDLLIPELENKPKNTKDTIISLLTNEWPLTLRGIYFKIKKKYSYKGSYQAVYKSVKELVQKKILIQTNKEYEINIPWIKNLQSFTDIVETNYYTKQRLNTIKGLKNSKSGQDIIILDFETIFDAEKYLYYFIKNELFKSKNLNLCFQTNHLWKPIFYLRAEYNFYKRLHQKGHKSFYLISGNTPIDKNNKEFYKSLNVNIKTTKQNHFNEIIVFKDFFIELFIPENIKTKLTKYVKENNALKLLTKVLSKKSSIKLIINKDKELANEIEKKIVGEF